MSTKRPPVFAVVGAPNRGKSSVVATLLENPSIEIRSEAGTTRTTNAYPMVVDGITLFTVLDTPGFEQADALLDAVNARAKSEDERPRALAEIAASAQKGNGFDRELDVLRRVLEGAVILYVVDVAEHYRSTRVLEMELLRFTGRPRMALLNCKGAPTDVARWRDALGQYFSVVREFNANLAGFPDRIALLRTLVELVPDHRAEILSAIEALTADRARRRADTAGIITEMLVDVLTLTLEETAEDDTALDAQREHIETRFHDALRAREQKARKAVDAIYHHTTEYADESPERARYADDLFAEATWDWFGLSSGTLLFTSATAGFVAGAMIDASVGGASWGTGAALGAAGATGLAALGLRERLMSAGLSGGVAFFRGRSESLRRYKIGPHRNDNFGFVVLDRAIAHLRDARGRAHARQDARLITSERSFSEHLQGDTRKTLLALFKDIRANGRSPERVAALYKCLRTLFDADER